ncbi:tRNA (N(6)-L-threonylcarbamoyladenosine(37)-C(2))-methylthiotransferase [Candidatus Woesearchaeota archaeon]|nr:tRNA (N(6)-L-threonylcarbamoyladenosine(37)-C(2))-methylthiotransferase [Candidatus Woesearchaeota archaeon]
MNVLVETYGCTANLNNSEIINGLLQTAGYKLARGPATADVFIINTCTVKGPTEDKILKKIKEYHKKRKNLIVAGCMADAQADLLKVNAKNAVLVGTRHITDIARVVDAVTKKKKPRATISDRYESKVGHPKISKNPIVEIVQISEGCRGRCNYCIVRLAKGDLVSFEPEKIIKQVKKAVDKGAKEVWITSQDNANYEYNLPDLLKKIADLRGDFMMRVGMMNPNNVLPILDELIEAYKEEKIFKFLHLPVQSGSDKVLLEMGRDYMLDDFKLIIEAFRDAFPQITIATDVICGYPTETDEDYQKTIDLINWLRPDMLHLSKFWPRSGTPASSLDLIDQKITNKRARDLTTLSETISAQKNKLWVGWTGKVLVDDKKKQNSVVARNNHYKQVILKGDLPLGKTVIAKVYRGATHHLIGTLRVR